MKAALYKVMPETQHGLCTWHIMQNGITHLENLMKDGSHFFKDFKKLMFEEKNESKFEEAWGSMLSKYEVEDNDWLKRIYPLKEKWAKCYMKTAVTLGMRSTQLSESFNRDLKDDMHCNLSINGFFKQLKRVVNEKRYNEKQAEYDAKEKLQRLKVTSSPLLQQAGKVYTPLVFEKFQKQWEKNLTTCIKQCIETDTLCEYVVASFDCEKEYLVTSNLSDQTVSCSCRKFENWGILFSHALKVLSVMNIMLIPNVYIVKRWTREARDGTLETNGGGEVHGSANHDASDRYRELCPELVKIANKASEFEKGHAFMKMVVKESNKHLDFLIKKHYGDVVVNCEPQATLSTLRESVQQRRNSIDHILTTAKGLKKKEGQKGERRKKGWVEKQGKKRKSNAKESHHVVNQETPQPLLS